MVETVITSVLEEALRQASERIAKKITEGKRLTSIDVIILLLDQINKRTDDTNKRIDDLNTSLNKRIDDTNRRIDDLRDDVKLLRQEVSSIKSDIINLLKERLTGTGGPKNTFFVFSILIWWTYYNGRSEAKLPDLQPMSYYDYKQLG
jgi:septal ring factor EnvC (AmiA/AmiB activator)